MTETALEEDYIELNISPKWKHISVVRNLVGTFLAIKIDDKYKADVITIAVSELLENAIKYSSNKNKHVRIHLEASNKKVVIIMNNHANEDEIPELKRILGIINNDDPFNVYIKQLKSSPLSMKQKNKSQLGLARIRYETNANIQLNVKDNHVNIQVNIDLELITKS